MSAAPARSPALRALAVLGRGVVALARVARDLWQLLHACGRFVDRVEPGEVVRQTYGVANRSLVLIAVVMGFTGAILVIQASVQALRIIGDLTLIGPTFLQLLVREFGPTIVAMMVAARYGAGIAAEIGAMVVTEQIDALRMAGEEPAAYLVTPRIVAGIVGMLALSVFGSAIAFAAGGLAAFKGFGVARATYFRLDLVDGGDLAVGLVKAALFGLAVPLVSSHFGLAARGGAAGVGRATTRAVIGSSLAVLILDITIGAVAYVLAGDVP